MLRKLEAFVQQIPDFQNKRAAELIDYFVYYLTEIAALSSASSHLVESCFTELKLVPYSNVASYLSRYSKKQSDRKIKYLKKDAGYILERSNLATIKKILIGSPSKQATAISLRDMVPKLIIPIEKQYLNEIIICYEAGVRRAAIILMWILTVNHLYEYVFKHQLNQFNVELAKNTDKRIKVHAVTKIDDFSEIPENKFIEFLKASNIITNDIRKILDTKLGIRNTSAHPSSVVINEVKATDFIEDLIDNILLKYSI